MNAMSGQTVDVNAGGDVAHHTAIRAHQSNRPHQPSGQSGGNPECARLWLNAGPTSETLAQHSVRVWYCLE